MKPMTPQFTKAFADMEKSVEEFTSAIDDFREQVKYLPIRCKTGVSPKIHNRTRKKQRLTRLQRRHKRQRS